MRSSQCGFAFLKSRARLDRRRQRGSSLQQRTQVVEAVEEVPDVVRAPLYPVRMQVRELRVIAVAVERFLGIPFDQDQYLPRRNLARSRLAEAAERHDAAAVRLHLAR